MWDLPGGASGNFLMVAPNWWQVKIAHVWRKKETHDFVRILNFTSSIMSKTLGFGLNEETTHVWNV